MPSVMPQVDRITARSNRSIRNRIIEASFGDGYVQKAPDGLNSNIDKWTIEFAPANGANLTELQNFITTVGTTDWFTWTPFGELTAKKFMIDKDSIKWDMLNTEKLKLTFTMTQVFNLG